MSSSGIPIDIIFEKSLPTIICWEFLLTSSTFLADVFSCSSIFFSNNSAFSSAFFSLSLTTVYPAKTAINPITNVEIDMAKPAPIVIFSNIERCWLWTCAGFRLPISFPLTVSAYGYSFRQDVYYAAYSYSAAHRAWAQASSETMAMPRPLALKSRACWILRPKVECIQSSLPSEPMTR